MALHNLFERIYVINLKTRTDRRAEMDVQLRRIGLGLNAEQVVLFEAVKPTDAAGFSSVGARGCFMSHLQLLREARLQGLRSVLILEDDLNFYRDFPLRFAPVAKFLATQEWGMFYGSYTLPQTQSPPQPPSALPCRLADPTLAIGTSAMLAVNGTQLDALIRYLEAMLQRPPGDPSGGPMHIDGAYCWFRRAHPELATWLASTQLGYQRSSRTDVHALRWFDRNPVSAALIGLARRWRNWPHR